ncbi:aliphatic sulfonate ABC transporter substrate-binding protein [bacterium]|nr:aliphatic sulfonate ABC transporter substrate-binding protein [bacterium]
MRRILDCFHSAILHRLALSVLFVAFFVVHNAAGAAPIKLGYSPWPGWFPWQIAAEKGLFKKRGVEVELVWYPDYLASMEALSKGKIDANSQTLIDALTSAASGKRLKVVLVNDNSTGNDQLIARKEIKSVADLKGKTVAAEAGTVDHFLLLVALSKAGLSANDIRFKNLPTDQAAAEFAKGTLDAVCVFAPHTTTALKSGIGHVLTSSKEFPGIISDHLVVSEEVVQKRADEVSKIVGTWFDTLAWMKANPAETLQILSKKAEVSEAEYKSYDSGTTLFTLEDNLKAFNVKTNEPVGLYFTGKQLITYLRDNKFISRAVSLNQILEPKFVEALAKGHGKAKTKSKP